jgi:hypothetical protein
MSISDLAAGIAASLAHHADEERLTIDAEKALQRSLDMHEPGARLDTKTPADDHCLFHAFIRVCDANSQSLDMLDRADTFNHWPGFRQHLPKILSATVGRYTKHGHNWPRF